MDKRIVCITGGDGRLGRELANAFIENEDEVVITGRDKGN